MRILLLGINNGLTMTTTTASKKKFCRKKNFIEFILTIDLLVGYSRKMPDTFQLADKCR